MEPGDRAAEALTSEPEPGPWTPEGRFRVRIAVGVLLAIGLAFVQDPGLVVADTKLDLVLGPGQFLERATHLWDAQGAFGQLQNQAYGYLWPIGPFFWVGALAGLPAWVIQRLWLGLVLGVAFAGAAKVTRALGVRSDFACLLAGAAYALSPRMVTTGGPISIEAWPSSLAPWVLLALVHGSRQGSPRRAAALAALGIAFVGGVNAVATFAVIPLGAVWLLTRSPGPRRRALMIWWPFFTALMTSWWLVPLLLMGRYSPPFLDYIESSSVTTFPTTVFDTLRGTSDWVPYVDNAWRAGHTLITTYFLPLNSGLLLTLGLAGLLLRRTQERVFLVVGLAVGILLVTMGHQGSVSGWWADGAAGLLDGVLSPLRNVHKFDPIVRLPLVIGLAWAVEELLDRAVAPGEPSSGGPRWGRLHRRTVAGLLAFIVATSALPVFQGRLTPAGGFLAVPGYWYETADWLADRADQGTALLVPGSSFGTYVWGSPHDEPMQALARSPWAVRNGIPLTPPANIRMLDAVEERLNQGFGSAGVAPFLRRAGVRYLVVRNDLEPGSDVPDPVLVHQALADSPGLTRVAWFGPALGGDAHLGTGPDRVVVNAGWQTRFPAVEIFEVAGQVDQAVHALGAPVVVGGPEDLLDLLDTGLVGPVPTRLAVDVPPGEVPDAPVILTDGLRARERTFGRIHDATSAVVTPGQERRSGNPTRDYLLGEGDRWSTTADLTGVADVTASSSESDATNLGGTVPGRSPEAALDAARATEWVSGNTQAGQTFWEVRLLQESRPDSVTVLGGRSADERQIIRVRTEAGVTAPFELGPLEQRTVDLPSGPTDWVRIESPGSVGRRLALASVRLPGVDVRRVLVLPGLPDGWPAPSAILLRPLRDDRTGCARVDQDVRCAEWRAMPSEEQRRMLRRLSLPAGSEYDASLRVRPRAGARLERVLQADQLVAVKASSRATADLRGGALATIDGSEGTAWTAREDDLTPTLTLSWLGARRITGLRLSLSQDTAARRPAAVTLSWPGGSRPVELDADGAARFPAIRTDQLSIRVDEAEEAREIDFQGASHRLSVGVGEVRLTGLPALPNPPSGEVRDLGCDSGPVIRVDGAETRTAVVGSPADVMAGRSLPVRFCGSPSVWLGSGVHHIAVHDSRFFAAQSLLLRALGSGGPVGALSLDVQAPSPSELRIGEGAEADPSSEGDGPGLLSLRMNANPGWTATAGSGALTPVTLDGWQQGFVSSGTTVEASFGPDRPYRWGLLAGISLFALVAAGVLLGRRSWWGTTASAPVGPGRPPRVLLPLVAVGLAGLVASWPGVLVATVTAVVAVVLVRRLGQAAAWVLGTGPLIAAVGYALYPWGDAVRWAGELRWPQLVTLASLTACVALGAVAAERASSASAVRAARPAGEPAPPPPG